MRFKFVIILSLFRFSVFGQTYSPNVQNLANSADQVIQHLKKFESLGVKETGTPDLLKTRDWLLEKYRSMGYLPYLDSFEHNGRKLYNVIASQSGSSSKYIIVCGHYDTRTGPGANDNGSGVSVILEMARLLVNQSSQIGVKYIHFSGEEDGLLGSKHYVEQMKIPTDSQLLMVLNLDQLGGSKGSNENLKIKTEYDQNPFPSANDSASLAITKFIGNCLKLYSNLEPVLDRAYSSDYIPFENKGYVITGLYQYSHYPQYHSENDLIIHMDTLALMEIAKGSVAALAHLLETDMVSVEKHETTGEILIYPNFIQDNQVHVHVSNAHLPATIYVYDAFGRNILKEEINVNQTRFSLPQVAGYYVVYIKTPFNIRHQKIFNSSGFE